MKTIILGDATYRGLGDAAILPMRQTGTRRPDGDWSVPVDDEVHERLMQAKLPGESDDDTVARLLRAHRCEKPN